MLTIAVLWQTLSGLWFPGHFVEPVASFFVPKGAQSMSHGCASLVEVSTLLFPKKPFT